jgi:cell division protein FtsL
MARAAAAAPARQRQTEPVRPGLTVVRRRRARRSVVTKISVLAFVALFASVLGVVVFQTLRAQNQTTLDALDHQVAAEQDRGKELRLQLADAESPDRIVAIAEQKLGMIAPNDVAYLQPKADDDAKAAWDAQKDPVPTTTVPTTVPPTVPTTTAPPTTWTPPATVRTNPSPTTTAKPTTTSTPTTRPSSPTTTAKPTVTTTVTTTPGTKR